MKTNEATVRAIANYVKVEPVEGMTPESVLRARKIMALKVKKTELDFADIPLDDGPTWDLIGTGYTRGVFQLEGTLGKRYAKEIKPRNIEELSDVVSLIRPGCLEAQFREKPDKPGEFSSITNTYIKIKNGEWEPEYIHPVLEDIFKDTNSVPVYQEQIMRICTDFAGFTLKEADVARKAVGKKKEDVMAIVKEKFLAGAAANGHNADIADTIFGWISKFSGYGFNKCAGGNTLLNRGMVNQHSDGLYTIGHLYKLVNDRKYAVKHKQISLRKKLRRVGYGNCMAVCADGRIRPMPIKTIHFNGKKRLVRVTDNGGRGITCTIDHKFMIPDGTMKSIEEIGVGGKVVCHIDCYDDEYIYDYSVHKNKKRKPGQGMSNFSGGKAGNFIDGNWSAFKRIKDLNLNIDYCQTCFKKPKRLEWHHIDGNRSNNVEDNLIKLCVSCHKKEDYKLGRNKRFDKGHKTGVATIISIEEFTEEYDTYDVEMDTPEHNWIADGFVVSNSHGVSYAMIGYKTAYAKCHYPLHFFKAMLTNSDSKQDRLDEIQGLVHEARLFNIIVQPPCLKKLNHNFDIVDDKTIAFGLGHIKGVGKSALKVLVKIAGATGDHDFLAKAFGDDTKVNKGVVVALIKSGALDYITSHRVKLLSWYKVFGILTKREREFMFAHLAAGSTLNEALNDLLDSKVPNKSRKPRINEAIQEIARELGGNPKKMCIAWEKYYLGIPLSGSLVDLHYNPRVNIKLKNMGRLQNKTDGCIGVVIEKIHKIKDKNHNEMCFLTVSDDTYMVDSIVVFSSIYNRVGWIIEEGKPVLITGKKDRDSFLVRGIYHL